MKTQFIDNLHYQINMQNKLVTFIKMNKFFFYDLVCVILILRLLYFYAFETFPEKINYQEFLLNYIFILFIRENNKLNNFKRYNVFIITFIRLISKLIFSRAILSRRFFGHFRYVQFDTN